jgi:hypothetical protein
MQCSIRLCLVQRLNMSLIHNLIRPLGMILSLSVIRMLDIYRF